MKKNASVVALLFAALFVLLPSIALAQCGVFKTWALNEILTSADLNSALTRTVNANSAACATGDSSSVGAMQATQNPYPGGSESLATNVTGELERLRFQLQAVVGKSFWYQPVDISLATGTPKHWGATYAQYTQIADPATPPAQNIYLYTKDDGAGNKILAYKQPSGSVVTLTGPQTAWGGAMTVNLYIKRNAGAPTNKIDVTYDRLSVQGFIGVSQSHTIDFTTTGANALDTGTIAAATRYFIWEIFNQTTSTFAGLGSTSESSPTMPVGYTFKRLIGMMETIPGAATFNDAYQIQNVLYYTTPGRILDAGNAATATSLDISAHAPSATLAAAYLVVSSNGNNACYVHFTTFANPPAPPTIAYVTSIVVGENTTGSAQGRLMTPVSPRTTIYYASNTGTYTCSVAIAGWEMAWRE